MKKTLDPLELVRFFQQYEIENGNYTEECKTKYKDFTVEQIYNEIKIRKKVKIQKINLNSKLQNNN